jgi:hypothetical protein
MAVSESSTPSNAQNRSAPPQDQARDVQTLISLLGDMVPLLIRMQTPAMGQTSPLLPIELMTNPMLDHQAAVCFVEALANDSLHTLQTYLESHRATHGNELEVCKPLVTQAANCVAVHDYAQAFDQIWQAYRLITALRAANPQLPPLRSASAGKSATEGSADRVSTH